MRSKTREIVFDVDASLARLIGQENVTGLTGAVLEIVKNAYDADANAVCIYYSEMEKCVYIMDNGSGMNEEIIRSCWMTIGRSSKTNFYVTNQRRIQTGKRGIGRFALERISNRCDMLTISASGGLEWVADWEDFDGKKRISDVMARLYDRDDSLAEFAELESWGNRPMAEMVKKLSFDGMGTAFRLDGLIDVWDDKIIRQLRNNLQSALSPDTPSDFRIYLFDDDTMPKDAQITRSYIQNYDSKIEFQVQDEQIRIQVSKKDPGTPVEKQCSGLSFCRIGENGNQIGDFSGTLYYCKDGSKESGGIKLYRDCFRVRPYGECGSNEFDWLKLSKRREEGRAGIEHPAAGRHVGPEQMSGTVNISRNNSGLEDTPERFGLQEGEGADQLKRVLLAVIAECERNLQEFIF